MKFSIAILFILSSNLCLAQFRIIENDLSEVCNPQEIFLVTSGEEAKFPGGMEAFYAQLSSKLTLDKNITKTIYLQCFINCKGNMVGITSMVGINPQTDKNIAAVLQSMDKWTPATNKEGIAVDLRKTIKIEFKKGKVVH